MTVPCLLYTTSSSGEGFPYDCHGGSIYVFMGRIPIPEARSFDILGHAVGVYMPGMPHALVSFFVRHPLSVARRKIFFLGPFEKKRYFDGFIESRRIFRFSCYEYAYAYSPWFPRSHTKSRSRGENTKT